MPTYAIRVESYADDARLFYVYTIGADGCRKVFAEGTKRYADGFARDLRKLKPATIAVLAGPGA